MEVTEDERTADQDAEERTYALELRIAEGANVLRKRVEELHCEAPRARRKRLKQMLGEIDQAYDELYELIALATDPIFTAEDVRRWCDRAVERGCAHPTFDRGMIRALLKYERVPNEPLRHAYLSAIERDYTQPGVRILLNQAVGGYVGQPGTEKLRRQLGIEFNHTASGLGLAFLMPYETAAALAAILGLNPHEYGV